MIQEAGGGENLPLNPLRLIPGCNTPAEVTRSQLKLNVERNLPWLETEDLKDKPLVIVAGGPSLKTRWPEILLHGGDILALNNAYGFLIEREIVPDYFMLLDAREENFGFLNNPSKATKHYIAAQCHPAIFDRLESYNTCLYLTILPETLELTAHIDKPKVRIAGSVGTVGMKALSLAYALGYRELHLYGYDSSYEDSEHHAFPQVLNDDQKTIDVYVDGKKYITTPTLAHQVSEFCALAQGMVRHGFSIELHCSGLLPDFVAHSNRLGEIPLEQREREKYEEVWKHDAYRKFAPGEGMVEDAVSSLGMQVGESVIDFGCGTGRGAKKLQGLGYAVTAVDFAENSMDQGIDVPFVNACLWDMPLLKAKWGYCTDVMEHIPPEKAIDVLRSIAERVENGAYFNIATVDDSLGGLIGRKLHMTVMTAENWQKLLSSFWRIVEVREREGEATFICFH